MSSPVFKIRASACNKIMGSCKQPIDEYNSLVEEEDRLVELQEKQKNKETKTYASRQEKIKEMAAKIKELEPKKDVKIIPQGAKTYCKEWLLDQIYGGQHLSKVETKYMSKGHQVEDENIQLYSDYVGIEFYKNDEWFENEWATGTPDILTENIVVDIKSSWDYTTFPLMYDQIPNKDYWAQLQVYMWLTGVRIADLAYVLTNTPENLRRSEIDCLNYNLIDTELRVKTFSVEYDEKFIEEVKERVEGCQAYIKGIIRQQNWQKYFA